VVYTENAKITRGKGNYFEFMNNSNTVEKLKSGEVWKKCAAYNLDIFIVNLFAFLILIAVKLIIGRPLEIYDIVFANLVIFAHFVYFGLFAS